MKLADRILRGRCDGLPKVSVATTTYKHEAFIGDAIESVLMQDTDFPVEMVIGEDCSPDRTQDVILQYARKYPGFIRLKTYRQNVGSNRNFHETLSRCRGEYVALLDGDDFWTSPDKLRLQAELLDSNSRFSMCFHAVNRIHHGRIVSRIMRPTGRKSVYRLADLAKWVGIMPLSMMFRRDLLTVLPAWFENVFFGDWALQILLAEKGDIAYIPRLMGTHRFHDTNMSYMPSRSVALHMQIENADLLIQHLGDERARPFRRAQRRRWYNLVHAYLDESKWATAQELFQEIRGVPEFDWHTDLIEPWLVRLHIAVPGTYRRIHPHMHRLLHPWGLIMRPAFDRLGFMGTVARQR